MIRIRGTDNYVTTVINGIETDIPMLMDEGPQPRARTVLEPRADWQRRGNDFPLTEYEMQVQAAVIREVDERITRYTNFFNSEHAQAIANMGKKPAKRKGQLITLKSAAR